jgi:ATP-dependent phosphoenolpyruvate carboxykinase
MPDFTVIFCPAFKGDPNTEDIQKENFTIINFEEKGY